MPVRATIVSLGMVTAAVPVILVSLLARRTRDLASDGVAEISFKEDLNRSLLSILPLETIRQFFKAQPIKSIMMSRRFKPFMDQLFIRVNTETCNGYWICKGPPGKPLVPKESDVVLLWFHGGGYCFGDPLRPAINLLRVAEIAAARGISMSIFSVEYTLAPAATFPSQQREAVAAYQYFLKDERIPADKIIMGGESAGAHLLLSCLMGPPDSLPRPRGALLLYPWVNLTNHSPTFESNQHKDVLSKRLLDRCVERAIGERGRVDALNLENLLKQWKPGTEKNWKGILPAYTWVHVGSHDVFLHDVTTFVENARNDGASVDLDIADKKPHAWNFAADRDWVDLYCGLRPRAPVPDGMMPGSAAIAEGFFRVFGLGV
ncbi:Alpha/Beta hydrolase protein [Aspergillus multicolor]|uniref:alpha/beta hydrolase n=1 Tax=Aspergillus multicolor TaxID=41759 RepID=UPI003CCD9DE3